MGTFLNTHWWVGDLMLSEALASATFDRLNCQHTGESDQNFSKKPHERGSAGGGGDMGSFGIDWYRNDLKSFVTKSKII